MAFDSCRRNQTHAIRDAEPYLNNVQIAQDDLAAAGSIEAGDLSQAALRLYLACRDLYTAIGEAQRAKDLEADLGKVLAHRQGVYLDTCIISSMVKRDLSPEDLASMELILDAFQADFIELRTSSLAKEELSRIPEVPRREYMQLFRLLRASEYQPTFSTPSDPKFEAFAIRLRTALSENDYKHLMEAVNINAEFFLTADTGVLAQKQVAAEMGLNVLSPKDLELELRRLYILPPLS